MNHPRRPLFLGSALVILGALMLLDKVDVLDITWPWFLVVIGAAFLVRAYVEKDTHPVFVGSLLVLLGVVFLADQGTIPGYFVRESWPLLILAVGGAFLVSWIFDRTHEGHLRAAIILLIIGGFFTLVEEHYIRWHVMRDISDWWPLGMLALGVWLIARPRREKQ
ncbi:MAG: DUF5668 domain-containing protein [bacterium]